MHVCGCWWDYRLWNFLEEKESQKICRRSIEHMGHENEKQVIGERGSQGSIVGWMRRLNENKCLKISYSNLIFWMLLKAN